ncbi:MAG TPA: Tm-1-like ATP-binding domain-containing protein [Verrucomicrobiales bacterium]|nr:Tm-1-like ATP-binding domain-containing protein [Verrucomicrobiales bacterium]
MAAVALPGTLDTKGAEYAFVAQCLRDRGHRVLLIDTGTLNPPAILPDFSRREVAQAAGIDLDAVLEKGDRGEAVAAMTRAAPVFLSQLHREGRLDAVLALGGSGGTAIATAAMRALPHGLPKVMVSTMASGNVGPYVDISDIVMVPSIVDIAGLNTISRSVLARAAGALCGMLETAPASSGSRPLVLTSMFGNTTDCVAEACRLLEEQGFEAVTFHAVGSGGRALDALAVSMSAAGILDITTTELADELAGGVLTAGPDRLGPPARAGIPAVVVPGCLDMVNFHAPETVPQRYAGRTFYRHNPQVTLMRTNAAECSQLGSILANKVNAWTGPVAVLLPLQAISVISAPGQPFHDPEADAALFDNLRAQLRPDIPVFSLDLKINDPAFARACVDTLLSQLPNSVFIQRPES